MFTDSSFLFLNLFFHAFLMFFNAVNLHFLSTVISPYFSSNTQLRLFRLKHLINFEAIAQALCFLVLVNANVTWFFWQFFFLLFVCFCEGITKDMTGVLIFFLSSTRLNHVYYNHVNHVDKNSGCNFLQNQSLTLEKYFNILILSKKHGLLLCCSGKV